MKGSLLAGLIAAAALTGGGVYYARSQKPASGPDRAVKVWAPRRLKARLVIPIPANHFTTTAIDTDFMRRYAQGEWFDDGSIAAKWAAHDSRW